MPRVSKYGSNRSKLLPYGSNSFFHHQRVAKYGSNRYEGDKANGDYWYFCWSQRDVDGLIKIHDFTYIDTKHYSSDSYVLGVLPELNFYFLRLTA